MRKSVGTSKIYDAALITSPPAVESKNKGDTLMGFLTEQNEVNIPIQFPVLNEITIPQEEQMMLSPRHEESNGNGEKRPKFYLSVSRMMYAAGDLVNPRPECVIYLINEMKRL